MASIRYVTAPPFWIFVLGVLAAWRVWKLLSSDDVLDYGGIRDRLAPHGTVRRDWLDCPYCAGFWVSLLGTLGYYFTTGWDTLGFLVTTFAMSAVVVWVEVLLDLTVAAKDNEEAE
jgi:hypothetical protein